MRKLRIIALMDDQLVPPDSLEGYSDKEILNWKTEFDVVTGLRELGHEVHKLGVSDNLSLIREAIADFKPHITFNLLEEFLGVAVYDQHVVSYLTLLKQKYTGCNPRGLMLSHDKALCKKLFAYHRIPTPKFAVFPRNKKTIKPPSLRYPIFVKSIVEDASFGISQASIVRTEEKLIERVKFVHDTIGTGALAEEFIDGREFYVGVMGNRRLQTFPVWELKFTKAMENIPLVATARVKWDYAYQEKLGVETGQPTDLSPATIAQMEKLSKKVYKLLGLSGYARMDMRMNQDGQLFVLEANPNPNLSYGEDFAESAHVLGLSYNDILQRIVHLGMKYKPEFL
jgi:D-alanine-D-alanine ligase